MQSVTAKYLKNRTGEILRRVRAGAIVAVTNRGRRVAVISPVLPAAAEERARGNADSVAWAEIRAALAATAPEHADWREALRRARGRP
jgi:prevent-host-death family protein